MKKSRSEFINVRGLKYHIRHWGNESAPKLFMVHGYMDVSASFQFVIDYLKLDWHVIAPDWRGYGLTDNTKADSYWGADYVGDFDAIVRHYSPNDPIILLGHSLGGNIATIYAGVRPARVKKLINVEGFGMATTRPEQCPIRYAEWLDDLIEPPTFPTYASPADAALRMRKANPHLTEERAAFLAMHRVKETEDGVWQLAADPAYKIRPPLLYQVEEGMACWRSVTASTLWIEGDDTDMWQWLGPKDYARAEIDRRVKCIPNVEIVKIKDAGHMVHHDQPEALANEIEAFLLNDYVD